MRAIVQRVSEASVSVDGRLVGHCGKGLLLLVGAHRDDEPSNAAKLADRVLGLRIFNDDAGKMNLSLRDLQAAGETVGLLAVSNFTVYGDSAKSRRPSFTASAPYEQGERLFAAFVEGVRAGGFTCETGEFGADMAVSLVNDGPVTLIVDA